MQGGSNIDNPAATPPCRRSLARFWPWPLLLALLLFAGFIRVRLLETPLERDEGEYAYAGQLILQGVPPYKLAYNMKLPGTYLAYAAGMALFGQTITGVHLTLIAANSLTIIFLFQLGRKLFGPVAGLVAGFTFGILSLSPAVLGLAAHATHFVILFAVPATWLLLESRRSQRHSLVFCSGLLYGLAFLMKQQGVVFGVFGFAFLVWRAASQGRLGSRDFLGRAVAFVLGMLLPFALTCLILALAGVFSEFWFWTFTYARSYVSSVPLKDGIKLLRGFLNETFAGLAGFWILTLVGLPVACLGKRFRGRTLFILLLLPLAFLGTATGLYFRPHYFILMLPAFALVQGAAIASLQQALRFNVMQNVWKSLPVILFSFAAAWTVFYQCPVLFNLSPVQVCQHLYGGNPFLESVKVGRYIREHSAEDSRIAVLGSEPQIYFYAHRRSATGYIYTYPIMESHPNALKMRQAMMQEIEAAKPEFLVLVPHSRSWLSGPNSDRTLYAGMNKLTVDNYEIAEFVCLNPANKAEAVWGDVAWSTRGITGDGIAIYRRKSPAIQ